MYSSLFRGLKLSVDRWSLVFNFIIIMENFKNTWYYRLLRVIYYLLYIISLIIGIIIFPIIIIIFELLRNIFYYIVTWKWTFKFNSKIWNYIIIMLNYLKKSFSGKNIFWIRRLKFIAYTLILFIFFILFLLIFWKDYSNTWFIILLIWTLAFIGLFVNLSYERLHNMWRSWWNVLWLLFPIANFVVLIWLIFWKENLNLNKKLEKENKILIISIFYFIIIFITWLSTFSYIELWKKVSKLKDTSNINYDIKKSITNNYTNNKLIKNKDWNIYFLNDWKDIEPLTIKATKKNNCSGIQYFSDEIIKNLWWIKDNNDYYSFVNYEILFDNWKYWIVKKVNDYCEASIDTLYFINFNSNKKILKNIDVKWEISWSHIWEVKLNWDILEVELYWASWSIKKYFNLKDL